MWTQYRGVARERARANLSLIQERRAVTLKSRRPRTIDRNTTVRDAIGACPSTLRVVIDLGIPVSCADRPIADAARVIGVAEDRLMALLREAQEASPDRGRPELGLRPGLTHGGSASNAPAGAARRRKGM